MICKYTTFRVKSLAFALKVDKSFFARPHWGRQSFRSASRMLTDMALKPLTSLPPALMPVIW